MARRSAALWLGRGAVAIVLIGATWVGAGCNDGSASPVAAVGPGASNGVMPGSGGDEPPNASSGTQPTSGSRDIPASVATEACASLADAENCGSCGHDCTALPNVVPEAMGCSEGVCVYGEGSCPSGFGHCSLDSEAGCSDSLGETAHCGSCDITCAAPTPLCASPPGEAARCVETCDGPGLTLCGDQCVDTSTHPGHCGGCFVPCAAPFAEVACIDSECVVTSCDQGFLDCQPGAGCETVLGTLENCAGCGDSCVAAANATPRCNAGVCEYECAPGLGDCDAASPDCETPIDTRSNCGGCGIECSGELGVCDEGVCSAACGPPREPCGSTCFDLLSSAAHCGACDSPCEAYQYCHEGGCSPTYRDTLQTARDYNLVDIAMQADGSFVVVGRLDIPVDIDPGAAVDVRAPRGSRDGLILMFDADGVLEWSRLFGADDRAEPSQVEVDDDGSVVVSFIFAGTIDFGAGSPPLVGTGILTSGVAKFDPEGNLLWARAFDVSEDVPPVYTAYMASTLGPDGTVYVGGSFTGTIDLDPTAGTRLARPYDDPLLRDSAFIAALSADGEFIWGFALTDCPRSAIYGLDIDPSGTLWAVGPFFDECDFDPGPAVVPAVRNLGFMLRFEAADGSFISGTSIEHQSGTFVFDDDGSTYFGSGATQAVLQKLDAAGAIQWTRRFDGTSGMGLARSANGGVVASATNDGFAGSFLLFEVDPEGQTRWQNLVPNVAAFLHGIASNAAGFAAIGETGRPDHDYDPGPPVELPNEAPTGFVTRYGF